MEETHIGQSDQPDPSQDNHEHTRERRKARQGEIAKIILENGWMNRPAREIAEAIYNEYNLLLPYGGVPHHTDIDTLKRWIRQKAANQGKESPVPRRSGRSAAADRSKVSEGKQGSRLDRTGGWRPLPVKYRNHPNKPPRRSFRVNIDANLMELLKSDRKSRKIKDFHTMLDIVLWNYYGQPDLSYPSDEANQEDLADYVRRRKLEHEERSKKAGRRDRKKK